MQYLNAYVRLPIAACLLVLTACGGAKNAPKPAESNQVTLVKEDLVVLDTGQIASGPVISGSLQAKKQADLRAEVPAIVLQVVKDNGDAVKKGDLLVRLDDTTFKQSLNSALEAERVAQQSFDQAERQLNRLKTLVKSGAVSTQALEDAELKRNATQSELASAKAKVTQDTQQVSRTEVRAPFNGIVSNREASNGDTAQVGKALLKVIDPSSIYFSGFVAADQVALLKPEQSVTFHINGFKNQTFEGRVERVNPVADINTRQVGVQVAVKLNDHLKVGMFAEGHIQASASNNLRVPEMSLVQQGDHTYVWRVKDNLLKKIEIKIGERDLQTGHYAVLEGLTQGDSVLRHPRGALIDGANVKLATTPSTNKQG